MPQLWRWVSSQRSVALSNTDEHRLSYPELLGLVQPGKLDYQSNVALLTKRETEAERWLMVSVMSHRWLVGG